MPLFPLIKQESQIAPDSPSEVGQYVSTLINIMLVGETTTYPINKTTQYGFVYQMNNIMEYLSKIFVMI